MKGWIVVFSHSDSLKINKFPYYLYKIPRKILNIKILSNKIPTKSEYRFNSIVMSITSTWGKGTYPCRKG